VLNLYEQDGARLFDSSPVIDADGTLLGCTRMMHITHYEGFWEQDYYDPGDTGAPVYQTAVGRLGVAIC
jgi:N-carbamoylputrescine amidase